MNNKINKGLITLTIGLLTFAVFNCNVVNTGNSIDLSQTINNQNISTQSSTAVQNAVSLGANTGVLRLFVSKFEMEHLNVTKGQFVISSVEVLVNRSNQDDHEGRDGKDEASELQNDHDSAWMTVSNYDVNGKLYEVMAGNEATYTLDTFLLPVGDYRQIRITLVDGQSMVLVSEDSNTIWHNVKAPSAEESGLKVKGAFKIENQMLTTVSFKLELEKTSPKHSGKNENGNSKGNLDRNSDYLVRPELHFVNSTITNLPVTGEVTYSLASGTYNADQTVSMSSFTNGATICYTTDGTLPACNALAICTSGNTYGAALMVTYTQVVSAVACKIGYTTSPLTSAVYTIQKTNRTAPGAGTILPDAPPIVAPISAIR